MKNLTNGVHFSTQGGYKDDELIQQIIDLKSELSAKDERIKILNEKIKRHSRNQRKDRREVY